MRNEFHLTLSIARVTEISQTQEQKIIFFFCFRERVAFIDNLFALMSEYSIQLTAEDSAMLATIKTQLGKLIVLFIQHYTIINILFFKIIHCPIKTLGSVIIFFILIQTSSVASSVACHSIILICRRGKFCLSSFIWRCCQFIAKFLSLLRFWLFRNYKCKFTIYFFFIM